MAFNDQKTDQFAAGYRGTQPHPQTTTVVAKINHTPIVDFTSLMSTTSIDAERSAEALADFKAGKIVYFQMPLQVPGFVTGNGEVSGLDTEANGSIQASTTSFSLRMIQVRCTAYQAVKWSSNEKQGEFEEITDAERKSQFDLAYEEHRKTLMMDYLVSTLITAVPAYNQGVTAGPNGAFNLGTLSVPVLFKASKENDSWQKVFFDARTILMTSPANEATPWAPGNMFAYVNLMCDRVMQDSRVGFDRSSFADPAFDHIIPPSILGFNLIYDNANRLLVGYKEGGTPVYQIIFGNRNATLLFCTPVDGEMFINSDWRTFTNVYRTRIFYQAKTIYPDQLVLAHVELDIK